MSKRLVIILWSLVAVLAALTLAVNSGRNRASESPTKLTAGSEILAKLPVKDIASVRLEDAKNTATLTRGETQWSVAERADYKVDFAKFSNVLRVLTEATVAQSLPAGLAFNESFGMDPEAENQENHGYQVTFLNAAGKEIESLTIGKATSSDSLQQGPPGQAASGRYVRLGSEPGAVYAVNDPFYGISGDPSDWIDQSFIAIEGIQSVDLATPNEEAVQGWTLTRESLTSDFTSSNLPAGRALDPAMTNPIKNVLSSPTLNDVLTEEEAKERRDESQARQLVIKTFDGFRYTIDYAPEKSQGEEESGGQSLIARVTVAGEIAATREKKEGESEEEAKKADEAFAARKKILQEKLAREQSFGDRYYALSSYPFTPVNVSLEELTQELPEPEPEPAAASPTIPQSLQRPAEPRSAATAPIAVPPLPTEE